MSESETKGRCRREIAAAFEGTGFTANKEDWILADAIDRIAADVAEIKANVDGVASEDNGKFVPSELEWNELVDCKNAANRERDEARAEVKRLKAKLAARPAAALWLTDRERQTLLYLRSILSSWGISPNYPEVKGFYGNHLECLDATLDRAGSPPVVEVPAMHAWGRTVCEEAQAYRDALDRAGVAWREVPRE